MDLHLLHVPAPQRVSRIQRIGNKRRAVMSSGLFLGSEIEGETWRDTPADVLGLCLPYLSVGDRSLYRCVCKAWKRVIDGPRDKFPGRYWLYPTPVPAPVWSSKRRSKGRFVKTSGGGYGCDEQLREKITKRSMELINLGRLDHRQLHALDAKDMGTVVSGLHSFYDMMKVVEQLEWHNIVFVLVAEHLVGFVSKQGVLVFNPLATGRNQAYSRSPACRSNPTFSGLCLKPDGAGFVAVVGSLTDSPVEGENVASYVCYQSDAAGCPSHRLPPQLRAWNTGPTASATLFQGRNLYWPTRLGEVVSFNPALNSWEKLGKPRADSAEELELLWHQGLFVWSHNLYYLGYLSTKSDKRVVNKIWKLNPSQGGAAVWDEEEMLPSHPCDSALPPESEGQMLEVALVIPWVRGRQGGADHDDLGRLHAGILAFNRSCNKWRWVSHCIHLWQEGAIVNRRTPTVLNAFEPNLLKPVHGPAGFWASIRFTKTKTSTTV